MIFETIAAMKAYSSTPQPNDRADVLGYHAAGDGGGGEFFWDAASTDNDDYGTVIQRGNTTPSGRWRRVFLDSLNVKWFGAKGDGLADDADRIERTINTAAASVGKVVIPEGTYKISKTIRANVSRSVDIVGYKATIIPVNKSITSSDIYKITGFREKPFLAIGPTAACLDHYMAFQNNEGMRVNISGLTFDGNNFQAVDPTNAYNEDIAIALVISAEYVNVDNCFIKNIFGYGVRVHGAKHARISNCTLLNVGGRGQTVAGSGQNYDAMGDGIYFTSFRPGFTATIDNCDITGFTQFQKRSRSAITVEYSQGVGELSITNSGIRHYAKCLHNESIGTYNIDISNCRLSDYNLAITHSLTTGTFVKVNNSLFEWDVMDGQESGGAPLLTGVFDGSDAKQAFDKCTFRYTGLNNKPCVIIGTRSFTDCDFFINNKNLAFADGADTLFDNCRFYDFGGSSYSSFTNYTAGSSTYKLMNCRFFDGGIVCDKDYPPKAPIIMINCHHNSNNALLLPNKTITWNSLFPNHDGLVVENIVPIPANGTGQILVNALTCPSPLWDTRRFIMLVIGTDANDSRKIDRQRIMNSGVNGYYKTELLYTTAGFHQVAGNTLVGGDNAADGYAIATPEGLTWSRSATGGANVTHIKFLMLPKHYENYL